VKGVSVDSRPFNPGLDPDLDLDLDPDADPDLDLHRDLGGPRGRSCRRGEQSSHAQ